MNANKVLPILAALLALDILLRLGVSQPSANAQSKAAGEKPHIINLSATTTDNGNQLLYRQWSDGSVEVRLANPFRTQSNDWPNGAKAGLSFQEGWKLLYKSE